jgi:hypothetical protein
MSMLTPSKSSAPAINICNRCILDINTDLISEFYLSSQAVRMLIVIDNPYNIQVGAFAKKCTKCATSCYTYILVEQPL